jgi:hypothetical protein
MVQFQLRTQKANSEPAPFSFLNAATVVQGLVSVWNQKLKDLVPLDKIGWNHGRRYRLESGRHSRHAQSRFFFLLKHIQVFGYLFQLALLRVLPIFNGDLDR